MESTNLKINVKAEKSAASSVKFDVEVPEELVSAAFKKVTGDYIKNVKLPGFRPGKSPIALLERQYGARIAGDVTYELIEKYLREAITTSEYADKTLGSPELTESKTAKKDEPFAFSFTIDLIPEFELPNYKGLKLTRKVKNVSDADVDDSVANFRKMSVNYEKTEDAAAENDMLIVDYKATIPEGVEFPETASYLLEATGSWLPLHAPERIPGVTAILAGKKAGDECDAEITFPADFTNEAFQGKKLTYHFSVKEVRKETLPEINDEFVKRFGVNSVEDFRKALRERLEFQAKQEVQQDLEKQISDQIFDGLNYELPERLVKGEVASRLATRIENEKRRGATQEEVSAKVDEMEKEIRENIEKALRQQFVLDRIIKAENIEFGQEDYSKFFHMVAAREPNTNLKKLFKEKQESGELAAYVQNVLFERAFEKIIELADVTEAPAEEQKESK